MSNPMLSALGKKAKPQFEKAHALPKLIPPPTTFHVNAGDVPGMKGMRPGQKMSMKVHGIIHSLDQDGNATLHIHRVLLNTDKDSASNQDTQD